MEDAYALIVLTLLQLCRGEISKPEWFSANLINDPGYTPKPITEIFTSDSTSKNPALFTQPTTTTSSAPTTFPTSTVFQNDNISSQQIPTQENSLLLAGQVIPQQPEAMSQVIEDTTRTELPSFVIIFDPKRQVAQNVQPLVTSPPPTVAPSATMPTDTTVGTESTSTIVPTVPDITPPFQPRNPQQLNNLAPPFWPPGSMFVYPLQISNFDPITNTTVASVTETVSSTVPPQPARPSKPLLTVRLKTPKGSITNIQINPTTTVRPLTTRRRRPTRKSNNYEICLSSCNGTKEPICSSPVGVIPVDPERLKGFASLCHMACHNSFRKEQVYEKVVDGRCGKLRTRIRPIDKNKLNRDELNKAQYTISHNGPETVMEFSPL